MAIITNIITTTGGGITWQVPAGLSAVQVEVIAAGESGGFAIGQKGGGGGGYSKSNAVAVTPGGIAYIRMPPGQGFVSGSSGDSAWFNGSANFAPTTSTQGVLAKTGGGGVGGQASAGIGNVKYSGGNGGNNTPTGTRVKGGGGGGAAGPSGNGLPGGAGSTSTSSGAGGGGGGSNAGGPGTGGSTTVGGSGGYGGLGYGGGTGATASVGAVAGQFGGGGGGGSASATSSRYNGASSVIQSLYTDGTNNYGPGGGGGGGGGTTTLFGVGGYGGVYGGGGGGSSSQPGFAGSSLMVITYDTASIVLAVPSSGNTFTDNSPSPKTYTASGDAQINKGHSVYSGSSMLFDGSGDFLTAATSTDFDLGSTYTIEYWIRPNSISNNFGIVHRSFYTTTSNTWSDLAFSHRWLGTGNNFLRVYFYATTAANEQYIDVTNAFTANTWTFVQVNRSGTTGEVFINGVSSGTITGLNTPAASTQTLRIGRWDYSAGNEDFNGYIYDLRITKGVARPNNVPTEQFADSGETPTPPLPDPYYSSVAALLYGNGTNGSTTFTDNSPSPKTYAVNGNAQLSTTQRKFGSSSMYFGGSGYIAGPTNAVVLSADYTVEFWVYAASAPIYAFCVFDARSVGAQIAFNANLNSDGSVGTYLHPNGFNGSAGALQWGQWNHVAFSRAGNTLRGYVNGTLNLTCTHTAPGNGANLARISGNIDGNYNLLGYLDDYRITQGVARYTANFTPPAQFADSGVADSYYSSVVALLHGNVVATSTGNMFLMF